MNRLYPVYTVEHECQDCYKCVRQCPAKAISVQDGHAAIVSELCVACGHCVQICPSNAKKVRKDLGRARHLLETGKKVYASVAPSWVSDFPELSKEKMAAIFKAMGFVGVSETAIGAQEVSVQVAEDINAGEQRLLISSACPSAVEFITKFIPEQSSAITQMASPLLAHARYLRKHFGEDIAVVFFGPCVAKKLEADTHPDEIQLALTFDDLRKWLSEDEIDFDTIAKDSDRFVPEDAEEGALYPIAGGMTETIRAVGGNSKANYVDITGLRNIENALSGFKASDKHNTIFLECLACEGGCVNGPCMTGKKSGLDALLEVRSNVQVPAKVVRNINVDVADKAWSKPLNTLSPTEKQIGEALIRVGKESIDDELNCGGCGYDSCRNFASALVAGTAEPAMCVSHMRQIAQRKANALLRCIPAGVVIVDNELKVVECNRYFADLCGNLTQLAFEAQPGMGGANLEKLLPVGDIFRAAITSGQDITREHITVEKRLFDISIFTIEPQQTAGAIIQDVTDTEMKREQIAKRASQVIAKNVKTVQEIACMLGEHMADTEIILNSIASDYGGDSSISLEVTAEDN